MSRTLLLAVGLGAAAAPLAAQETASVDRLAWFQGCWEAASPQRTIEEYWMAPRGGSMVGMSRTVRGGQLADHELVMMLTVKGQLIYRAFPSDQPSTDFPAVVVSDTAALFENPGHDFPQRIGYVRRGTDSLLGWIEGSRNGQIRRVEFRFARARCPGH